MGKYGLVAEILEAVPRREERRVASRES